jgi:flagellar protein FlaG
MQNVRTEPASGGNTPELWAAPQESGSADTKQRVSFGEDVSSKKMASAKVAPKEEEVRRAVDEANDMAEIFDRNLNFRYKKEADLIQVEVIENQGGKEEVVRKIPPDEVVRFIENVREMFGALIDVKA